MSVQNSDIEEIQDSLQLEVERYQKLLKESQDCVKQCKQQTERDAAVLNQKIQFLEMQIEDYKCQLNENKQAQDAILSALECTGNGQKQYLSDHQIMEIKAEQQMEFQLKYQEFESSRRKMQEEIQKLNEQIDQQSIKLKMTESELQKEYDRQNLNQQELDNQRMRMAESVKQNDILKSKMQKELEDRYQQKIKSLEYEIEQIKESQLKEIEDQSNNYDNSINFLKNQYELDKQRMEQRLIEEKARCERRLEFQNDELEEKYGNEIRMLEEDIQSLKDEKQQQLEIIRKIDQECQIEKLNSEELQKQIKEMIENHQNKQNKGNMLLEQQLQESNQERMHQLQKIGQMSQQMNQYEKDVQIYTQQIENLQKIQEEMKISFQNEKSIENQKLQQIQYENEQFKLRLKECEDTIMTKKIYYEKELALSKQSCEFLNKKVDDQNKQFESFMQRYEDKLKTQKQELLQQQQIKIQEIIDEKEQLEHKYQENKKLSKESKQQNQIQQEQMLKDKLMLQHKLKELEEVKNSFQEKIKMEMDDQQTKLQSQIYQLQKDKSKAHLEIDQLQKSVTLKEQENNDLISNYERDKILWAGKFTFLEGQKNQAKQDLQDSLKKFELTLQHLKKARQVEQSDHDNGLHELMHSMEKKYGTQIQDLNENNKRIINELEDKIKQFQREHKVLNEKILILTQEKIEFQRMQDLKAQEYQENYRKLEQSIEQFKDDKSFNGSEFKKNFEHEKEVFLKKIHELEQKCKMAEHKRSQLIFEIQKERAQRDMERDELIQQKEELGENLEGTERKMIGLQKEIDRMKKQRNVQQSSYRQISDEIPLKQSIYHENKGMTVISEQFSKKQQKSSRLSVNSKYHDAENIKNNVNSQNLYSNPIMSPNNSFEFSDIGGNENLQINQDI